MILLTTQTINVINRQTITELTLLIDGCHHGKQIEEFHLPSHYLRLQCRLNYSTRSLIRYNQKATSRIGYLPISLNDFKEENKELYNIVVLGIEDL